MIRLTTARRIYICHIGHSRSSGNAVALQAEENDGFVLGGAIDQIRSATEFTQTEREREQHTLE